MAKQKNKYNEIDDIKKDLNSLKDNVVELTKHVKDDGNEQAAELAEAAKAQLRQLNNSGKLQMKRLSAALKASRVSLLLWHLQPGFSPVFCYPAETRIYARCFKAS